MPHIEPLPALPRSPALAPTSLPTISEGPDRGSMGSVETMRERNNELLSLWQSTMVRLVVCGSLWCGALIGVGCSVARREEVLVSRSWLHKYS